MTDLKAEMNNYFNIARATCGDRHEVALSLETEAYVANYHHALIVDIAALSLVQELLEEYNDPVSKAGVTALINRLTALQSEIEKQGLTFSEQYIEY